MAGMVPATGKTSGRKQWTLHDGPRGSLQRLRNLLAEDGCPESQAVLAKLLLEERCELDYDQKENARIAVYWLIKSSEQGNEEATSLLEKCFRTGRGINEHNYLDVKSCINMTQDEKLARKAAREMFASLSNGEDFITSEQLQKRMIEICKNEERNLSHKNRSQHVSEDNLNGNLINNNEHVLDEEIDWFQRVETENKKLTEENLVSAAVHYAHGELPLENEILCLTTPNPRALDHIAYFNRSICYPELTFRILYYKLIRFISNWPYLPFFPLAKSNYQLLILYLVYCLFGTENVLLFIPMVLFYVSFLAMVVTTFQALQVRYNYRDFRVWSSLFLSYSGGSLNAEEAEYQFIRNNLKPFGQFFLALLIHLMIYPMVATQWIPQSEFTVISFALTFLTLITFMRKRIFENYPDWLLLFSFGINVLARYPYESDAVVTQGWRFLDLKVPSFASYVIGNGIEFCLTFRILFFLIIPLCFIKIMLREKGKGIYKFLIPHCLTLSWLQIVIINSQGATMFGLLRGTLALVGVVLFLPLAGLASFLLPIVALSNYVYESDYFMSLAFMTSFGLCLIISSWILSYTRYSKYITLFQLSWGILAVSILLASSRFYPYKTKSLEKKLNIYEKYNIQTKVNFISWEQYRNFCHQPSWEETSMAATQLKCSQLEGTQVRWEGYISNIKLKQIKNHIKSVVDKLPDYFKDKFYCLLGEKIVHSCSADNSLDCHIQNSNRRKCHLAYYDKYEFELTVKLVSGVWGKTADIILIADHLFTNFTIDLKQSDKIWFRGTLSNEFNEDGNELIGGIRPHLKLLEIGCITCHNVNLTTYKNDVNEHMLDVKNILTSIWVGFKCVLNFLLNPIVLFK